MCSMEKETETKKVLRSLCLSYGWSYGVFWRFNRRNSMLLTLEDSYSMEYARSLTDDMLLQVHMLGEGVIGQAALDGKHRWLFLDSSTRKFSLTTGHAQIQQTMAVIPIESCGVLQFGSVNEILETPGFVDNTRRIFLELCLIDGLVPSSSATSSLITDSMDQMSFYLDQSGQFGHNGSLCNDPTYTTNNSVPSSSCFNNQVESFGFNPLSFLEGSVDNQCLDSLFYEPSSVHGFDEFNSAEFHTTSHQEPTLNDDLLQTLLAELPSSNADLFSHGFEPHFSNVKREETLEDILYPPMIGNKNVSALELPSDVKVGSSTVPKKGLFSELGLDQLLTNRTDSGSLAKSSIEDPIRSPKRRRVETWSDKCFTADTKSCITDQTKRLQESSKATKKRARPGESPRGRPKDRQMIQDRIKELRDIIPNGSKCSIDSLLDQTIKHMLFMQGVSKHVDKLKRVEETKAQRNISNNSGTSGSTAWAVEVGGHSPIVVEDLGHSGQMLIEMMCEEQVFFLEIADVIRGFGLTILKGVMEAGDGKIWAHFIVEANRHVTRMEVLMSLLQLLKEPSTVGLKSVCEGNKKVYDNKTSVLSNYYPSAYVVT